MSVERTLWPYDVRAALGDKPPAEKAKLLASIGINPDVLKLERHATAGEMRAALGAETFDHMFKFAFVRNPWDFQLSLYHFNLTHPEFPGHQTAIKFRDFEDYIMTRPAEPAPQGLQKRYIVDNDDELLVDFVGRFETLSQDFATIRDRLGLKDAQLAHENRTQHPPWQKSYTLPMFERVRTLSQADIAYFGYSDDPAGYGLT